MGAEEHSTEEITLPPPTAPWKESPMRCEAVLRAMGQRVARTQNKVGIPEKFCAHWEADWLDIVDKIKSGEYGIEEGVQELADHAKKMTIAQIIWGVTEEYAR